MLGSKSNYFFRPKEHLKLSHRVMVRYLVDQNYSMMQIGIYEKAFEYFCENPSNFDGASIVKDLHHIPGLDLNAMLHDYHYLNYNCACDIWIKWHCDLLYAKEMEKTGKGHLSWFNFVLLNITGLPFHLYSRIKKGRCTDEMKRKFLSDYRALIKF